MSDCIFLGSCTSVYTPRRKASSSASCLCIRVLTVTISALLGETRIYYAIYCRTCVLPWSRTSVYAPCGKSAPFASCLYLRVLTVYVFARQSETRIQAKQSLSLPAADSSLYTKEPWTKRLIPLLVQGRKHRKRFLCKTKSPASRHSLCKAENPASKPPLCKGGK